MGYMGSGKSTVGKSLARLLQRDFLDLDHMIERHAGSTIPEIISRQSIEVFRQIEVEVLMQLEHLPAPHVVATGGGTPCSDDNLKILGRLGTTIFLDAPPDLLAARLHIDRGSRPLLPKEDDELEPFIRSHLKARIPFYSRADLRIRTVGTPQEIASTIKLQIEQAG